MLHSVAVGGEGRILCFLVVGDAELAPLSPCGGEGRNVGAVAGIRTSRS
jgi:hypothetical protein